MVTVYSLTYLVNKVCKPCSLIKFNFTEQLGKVYGVESFVLGPKESKELYPLLNVDDLYGTLHSPGDGTIDPASWATTLSRAAIMNGGKV